MRKQKGVALIAVIFLIVVIAAAIGLMSVLAIRNTESGTQTLLAKRANQMASAGIDWAVQTIIEGGDCGADIDGHSFTQDSYTVILSCESGDYNRTSQRISLYEISASSEYGVNTDADYVWTKVNATLEF